MINQVISFEKMEFRLFRKLTEYLGLSFSELIDLSPALTPRFKKNGTVEGYMLSFRANAPTETLLKIKDLSDNLDVYIGYYVINGLVPLHLVKKQPIFNNN